ncbi:acyl-CoA/acyl-ACP dehydrogenase [Stieleria sp. TO1_6]|uniref:acyl-CoA dehydrogenase family protein n=1 Tax=Stieleria tagensis TaxID=2956795 RepID=UPI00209AD53D|nr:acyl-CoA dehydrogenase family protein [Stieleria tagensis]MCO8121360.1 acyl-CoA/acyl-ACP dehydrogenase [Stieleria tagensis]
MPPHPLDTTFQTLARDAARWRTVNDWPSDSLVLCGRSGLFRGLSGLATDPDSDSGWSPQRQLETMMELATADLLTTFVITQHLGAIKRLLNADHAANNPSSRQRLGHLLSGDQIASVGISHLTTSRRHLNRPAVLAQRVDGGYRLTGTIPWVTGARHVDQIVVGASLDDQSELLALITPDDPGVDCGPGAEMIAMTASCTDQVILDDVFVADAMIISGPKADVLTAVGQSQTAPTGAGGLQTSALALGLSTAALNYLRSESEQREHLRAIVDRFSVEHQSLRELILAAAAGQSACDSASIRSTANGLVQRTTSAAMTTAKGAGLMIDHPVGRWCQQAFFFLVWSCPQPVAQAHLCELVGLE